MATVAATGRSTNASKNSRKRLVTKNELKRILLCYTSKLPCTAEACKVEKRELNAMIKKLQEEIREKDTIVTNLNEKLSLIRLAVRDFSSFIATNFPGAKIAIAAQKWEKRWKQEDEEGLWNKNNSDKKRLTILRQRSQVKPTTSAAPSPPPTGSNIRPKPTVVKSAELQSPQQNNPFHDFARQNVIAISRPPVGAALYKRSTNSQQRPVTPTFSPSTSSETSRTGAATALVSGGQPLNMSTSVDGTVQTLVPTGTQYILQNNNAQKANAKGAPSGSRALSFMEKGKKLAYHGYVYNLDRNFGTCSTWSCEIMPPNCFGRGKLYPDGQFIITAKHSHRPKSMHLEAEVVRFHSDAALANSDTLRANTAGVTIGSTGTVDLPGTVSNLSLNKSHSSAELKRRSCDQQESIMKLRRTETVSDIIVLSDDDNDVKDNIVTDNVITIPYYKSSNIVRCKKSHPLVYPKLSIYPGLRISRLHITWDNSPEDLAINKRIILNIQYTGDYSKQLFHILYYIRSMVESGEAQGWTRIYSKECEAAGKSQLLIQFYEGQAWFNDTIYFTGFIECGMERYGAYADVCKVNLGEQEKEISTRFRRYW